MTDLSRRTVLGASATGIAAGVVGAGDAAAVTTVEQVPRAAARAFTTKAGLYWRSRYQPLRGKRFSLTGPGGLSRTVVLQAVDDLPFAAPGAERAFVLTFRCTTEGPPQGTFTIQRRRFDKTSLFLVPSDSGRRTYHAVVDRRR